MNYSLKQLKVFVTVAQEKSFSRAGERIGLSQSAVSHSVKELENHTGVRLLDRTTREVVLTDAGQQLALRLERLLDELNSTLRDTGRMGQQLSGKVRVAASQTISAHLIPQCIAESHRRYPDIQFVLHDRPQQWVMESIRQGDVDFGIVIDPGPVGDLQCEAILSEPFFLLCHRDSALAVEDYVPLPEGSPLVVKRITPVVERQLMLVRRKNRSLSTAAEALWDVVRDQGRALMAGREGDPLYQI